VYWHYDAELCKLKLCKCCCRRPGAGSDGPLGTCTIIKKRKRGKAPKRSGLRDAALKHLEYMKGATRYPLERNVGGGYMCMINDR
jgi:hypothetical protein